MGYGGQRLGVGARDFGDFTWTDISGGDYLAARGDRTITQAPPPPASGPPGDPFAAAARPQMPSYQELLPDMLGADAGHSVQYQTSTHNLRIESAQNRTRFVVDGVSYPSLEAIPGDDLRKLAGKLLDQVFVPGPVGPAGNEMLRQVDIGNQTTIEAKSGGYTVSIQREGRQARYIVNGLTYYSPKEIPDPEMRRIAQGLEQRLI